MEAIIDFIGDVNDVIWQNTVLYVVLGVGVLFTIWSAFCQYRALTHGVQVTRGKYDDPDDPGAINHFQALSAALSATVGLGNIGGVALAIALGGPGAVFWMWVVGVVGMALKTTEVTLSMMYRNTDDPDNPHGGPMWVVSKGMAQWNPNLKWLGSTIGWIFCVTLIISAITGGNMFQSWNVADVTHEYFGVPQLATGIVLAIVVGMVIIGGIKRIGAVAGRLVPLMCVLYFLSAIVVLVMKIDLIPQILVMIFKSAFSPQEAGGAFIGGTAGYALLWGMKRALFSSEAGQGSSPIAHSAAKTKEPVREAVVAGLEPFIDTIVVCTLTALVILSSGIWNRGPGRHPPARRLHARRRRGEHLDAPADGASDGDWTAGNSVYTIVAGDENRQTGNNLHQLSGTIAAGDDGTFHVDWDDVESVAPSFDIDVPGVEPYALFISYQGATLTARSFDSAINGLGKWLVTLAAWLFAISTMISWSYYGEQGIIYMAGERAVLPYKLAYCALVIVAAIPQLVNTDAELDALTSLGTGVMLWANIPIMLLFGMQAMRAYHAYMARLKAGEFSEHAARPLTDLVERDDREGGGDQA